MDSRYRAAFEFVPATPRPSWWAYALGAALVAAVVIVGGIFNV